MSLNASHAPVDFAVPPRNAVALPSPLVLLTLFMCVVVVLRARVYWIGHRHRTAWIELEAWTRSQARSARRAATVDLRAAAAQVTEEAPESDDVLVGARR